ncbi:MAG: hypothetical protein JOZ92_10425 [Candidatus Dormibacteraeota bacterium]|nr:hypothetical protein [Candidatus Dormibacteraeota bacterium]
MPPSFPAIVRPQGLAKAAVTPALPEPQHHHLPAWVRRAHGLARPILADELAALEGEPRRQLEAAIAGLVAAISSGKFSQAFRYQEVVALGERLLAEHRRDSAERQRAQRALDTARRRVSDRMRDDTSRLQPEVATRLNRALRSAGDLESIAAVGAELQQAVDSARSVEDRRRDREVDKTRKRIQRAVPRGGAADQPEDWQDVLRRLQQTMRENEGESGTPVAVGTDAPRSAT